MRKIVVITIFCFALLFLEAGCRTSPRYYFPRGIERLFPEPKGVPSRTYQKQKNEKLDAAVAAVVMFIRREKQDVSPSFVFFIAEFGKDARKRVKQELRDVESNATIINSNRAVRKKGGILVLKGADQKGVLIYVTHVELSGKHHAEVFVSTLESSYRCSVRFVNGKWMGEQVVYTGSD